MRYGDTAHLYHIKMMERFKFLSEQPFYAHEIKFMHLKEREQLKRDIQLCLALSQGENEVFDRDEAVNGMPYDYRALQAVLAVNDICDPDNSPVTLEQVYKISREATFKEGIAEGITEKNAAHVSYFALKGLKKEITENPARKFSSKEMEKMVSKCDAIIHRMEEAMKIDSGYEHVFNDGVTDKLIGFNPDFDPEYDELVNQIYIKGLTARTNGLLYSNLSQKAGSNLDIERDATLKELYRHGELELEDGVNPSEISELECLFEDRDREYNSICQRYNLFDEKLWETEREMVPTPLPDDTLNFAPTVVDQLVSKSFQVDLSKDRVRRREDVSEFVSFTRDYDLGALIASACPGYDDEVQIVNEKNIKGIQRKEDTQVHVIGGTPEQHDSALFKAMMNYSVFSSSQYNRTRLLEYQQAFEALVDVRTEIPPSKRYALVSEINDRLIESGMSEEKAQGYSEFMADQYRNYVGEFWFDGASISEVHCMANKPMESYGLENLLNDQDVEEDIDDGEIAL